MATLKTVPEFLYICGKGENRFKPLLWIHIAGETRFYQIRSITTDGAMKLHTYQIQGMEAVLTRKSEIYDYLVTSFEYQINSGTLKLLEKPPHRLKEAAPVLEEQVGEDVVEVAEIFNPLAAKSTKKTQSESLWDIGADEKAANVVSNAKAVKRTGLKAKEVSDSLAGLVSKPAPKAKPAAKKAAKPVTTPTAPAATGGDSIADLFGF